MTATATITYKRGKTFVKNLYQVKDKDKKPVFKDGKPVMATAHGLVGELWIHGLMFETIERMDGYMRMAGGKTYRNSSIYWDENYGSYVINPWLGADEATQKNILMHPANQPSHVEGCVAVGFFNANGRLEESKLCFDVLWEQCGGRYGAKEGSVVLTLEVDGDMPSLAACKPWAYEG